MSFYLEDMNVVCPRCGSGNWMRRLKGRNVGRLDVKCINCFSYYNEEELRERTAKQMSKDTNRDMLRKMSDEELAEWFWKNDWAYLKTKREMLEWLRKEASAE